MGIDPYRQVGSAYGFALDFKKALHPAGGRHPLHASLPTREIFVQGKAGAGRHPVRRVRPTRPCARKSPAAYSGFVPAGRRCRAVPDLKEFEGCATTGGDVGRSLSAKPLLAGGCRSRRRRRWSQRRNRPAPAQRRSCPWQASGSRIAPSASSKRPSSSSSAAFRRTAPVLSANVQTFLLSRDGGHIERLNFDRRASMGFGKSAATEQYRDRGVQRLFLGLFHHVLAVIDLLCVERSLPMP